MDTENYYATRFPKSIELLLFGMQFELLQQQVDNLRRKVNHLSSISAICYFLVLIIIYFILLPGENAGCGKSTNTVPSCT
jgi:hypothetical protein